jgi:hypothetical protein
MTTIIYKSGQFQTEDGIVFEDQNMMYVIIGQNQHPAAFIPGGFRAEEGSTYSIREKVEVVRQRHRGWGITTEIFEWKDCPMNEVSNDPRVKFRTVARIVEEKSDLFDTALSKVSQPVKEEVDREFNAIDKAHTERMNNVIYHNGELRYNKDGFPEKPDRSNFGDAQKEGFMVSKFQEAEDAYEKSIKDSIPFENHNDCFFVLCDKYKPKDRSVAVKFQLVEGATYQIDKKIEWTWINPCIPTKKCLNKETDSPCKQNCAKMFVAARIVPDQLPQAVVERNAKINLLSAFCQFLEDQGYMDSDWKDEPPYAIDEFLKLHP